jgi:hypothetical protein
MSSGSDITAVVKEMKPWYERTQLQLVVNGLDQADYKVGQRLACRTAAPPAADRTAYDAGQVTGAAQESLRQAAGSDDSRAGKKPALVDGSPISLLGTIIPEPAKNVADYEGNAPTAVWGAVVAPAAKL